MSIRGVRSALVVGGGISGMAAAIMLRDAGVAVDLVDSDPQWRVYGAGITITGATLRAYQRLGLLPQIRARGAICHGTCIRLFDGTVLKDLDEPLMEDGLPATGGILRPVLHQIMSARTRESGTDVRLGLTVEALNQDGTGVDATFTDGTRRRYDLVVGADGIYSGVRAMLFPDAVQPAYTGQGSWRILAKRPEGFDKIEFYFGHANVVGCVACSADQVYVFVLNEDPDRTRIEAADQPARVRALLADFGGNIATVRDAISAESSVIYRPLEAALQRKPWHLGRAVIIGDAAHATTPHLASGAGIAVEDAIVLAEELAKEEGDVSDRLSAFTDRRFERCRMVVENSVAIGRLQLNGAHFGQVGDLIGRSLHALAADI